MTREAWERTITDSAGNVLTGVQVSVFQSDGSTVATIYGQQSGGAPIANPFNTGVQTSAKFYADPGRYVVRVLKDSLTKEFTDVSISDKAIRDDLGTAAYLTATTGVGDTTTGRAAKIGDHGLGLSGSDLMRVTAVLDYSGGVDFNTLTKPGWYKVLVNYTLSSNSPPLPPAANGYWFVHVKETAGSQIQQTAYAYLTASPGSQGPSYTFERCRYDGYFSPKWNKVSGPDVGTVQWDATHGSIGAIIERGGNANGEYVKFADGTMICTYTRTASIAVSQYGLVSGLYAGSFVWTFPSAFTPAGHIAVSGVTTDQNAVGWISAIVTTGSTATVFHFTASTSVTALGTTVAAIGRWR